MNSSAWLAASLSFMGIPFGDGCVGLHRKPFGVSTIFCTHRHSIQRTGILGVDLPDTLAARGKTFGLWWAGAVGVFLNLHAKNFAPHSTGNSTGNPVKFFYQG